jgi:hypothetical protein
VCPIQQQLVVALQIMDAANPSPAIGRWAHQAKKEEEEQINVVLFVNEN